METPDIARIQRRWLGDAVKRIRELESENKDLKLQVSSLQAELITSKNYYERRLQHESNSKQRQCIIGTCIRRIFQNNRHKDTKA